MGSIETAPPVLLLAGITVNSNADLHVVTDALVKKWGNIRAATDCYRFDPFTSYYRKEMGRDLTKQIIVFSESMMPEQLPDRKTETNDLEHLWTKDGKRSVNIDPGYLTPLALVLATTKPAGHRVYLRDGIYAETTLRYVFGSYSKWEWTYPDYAQPSVTEFLNSLRPQTLALAAQKNAPLSKDIV